MSARSIALFACSALALALPLAASGCQQTQGEVCQSAELDCESGLVCCKEPPITASARGICRTPAACETSQVDSGIAPVDSGEAVDGGGTEVDSGAVDSGTVDSGAVDSGTVDSGAVDSGTVDSGAVDSGTVDSGSVDSGSASDSGSDAA